MAWAPEYPCISADPPWNEQGGGKIKRGADRHYALIKKREDILRVMVTAPCWRPADNAHLWLWVTNNHLPDGLWLMDAFGFRYVTNRAWAKMTRHEYATAHMDARGDIAYKPQRQSLGQYLPGRHELLLFGVRGRLPARWKGDPCPQCSKPLRQASCGPVHETLRAALPKAPTSLLTAPRGEHSEKPAQAYDEIPQVSPGPRLEMFARQPRDGWDVWGNEVGEEPDARKPCEYCFATGFDADGYCCHECEGVGRR